MFIVVVSKTGIVKANTKTCGNCGSTNVQLVSNSEARCDKEGIIEYRCIPCGALYYKEVLEIVQCTAEDEPRFLWVDEEKHKEVYCCKWCEEEIRVIGEGEHEIEKNIEQGLANRTIEPSEFDKTNHKLDYYCAICTEFSDEGDIAPIKTEFKPHEFEDGINCGSEEGYKCTICPDIIKGEHILKYKHEGSGVEGKIYCEQYCQSENCMYNESTGTPLEKNLTTTTQVEGAVPYDNNGTIVKAERVKCDQCGTTWDSPIIVGGSYIPWDGSSGSSGSGSSGSGSSGSGSSSSPGGGYTPSTPTVSTQETCEHNYSIGHDDNIHWTECSKCNSKMENSEDPHTFGEATDDGGTTGTHSSICTFEGCGYKQTTAHEFDENGKCTECDATTAATTGCDHDYSETGNDDTYHWTKCSKCPEIQEGSKEKHELGEYEDNLDGTHTAKCTKTGCEHESALIHEFGDDGNCTECDAKACDEGEHDFSIFKWNDEQHWLACKWCENAKKDSIENHNLGEWTTNAEGKQQAQCTHEKCEYVTVKEAELPSSELIGDVNLSGEVDISDITALKGHVLAELSESKPEWLLTGQALALADLNKDGNVDISDIVDLKLKVLNLILGK